MIDLLKQKKTWFRLCVALLVLPAGCWFLLLMIGFLIPKSEEKTGLQIPRAKPRTGYEIIFPEMYNGKPDPDTFYYVNNKRQVIYRYDKNRYLELQGEDCQGLMWYHDDEKNIHTRIDEYFFTHERMPLQYQYFNPGKQFIGIPTGNLSEVMVSFDYGKTFAITEVTSYAAVPGEEVERFIGVDQEPLLLDAEKNTILPGRTGYFILKNKDILFGYEMRYIPTWPQSTYFSLKGASQGFDPDARLGQSDLYQNPIYHKHIESAKNIVIEPYEGWDRIRCEVGAEVIR